MATIQDIINAINYQYSMLISPLFTCIILFMYFFLFLFWNFYNLGLFLIVYILLVFAIRFSSLMVLNSFSVEPHFIISIFIEIYIFTYLYFIFPNVYFYLVFSAFGLTFIPCVAIILENCQYLMSRIQIGIGEANFIYLQNLILDFYEMMLEISHLKDLAYKRPHYTLAHRALYAVLTRNNNLNFTYTLNENQSIPDGSMFVDEWLREHNGITLPFWLYLLCERNWSMFDVRYVRMRDLQPYILLNNLELIIMPWFDYDDYPNHDFICRKFKETLTGSFDFNWYLRYAAFPRIYSSRFSYDDYALDDYEFIASFLEHSSRRRFEAMALNPIPIDYVDENAFDEVDLLEDNDVILRFNDLEQDGDVEENPGPEFLNGNTKRDSKTRRDDYYNSLSKYEQIFFNLMKKYHNEKKAKDKVEEIRKDNRRKKAYEADRRNKIRKATDADYRAEFNFVDFESFDFREKVGKVSDMLDSEVVFSTLSSMKVMFAPYRDYIEVLLPNVIILFTHFSLDVLTLCVYNVFRGLKLIVDTTFLNILMAQFYLFFLYMKRDRAEVKKLKRQSLFSSLGVDTEDTTSLIVAIAVTLFCMIVLYRVPSKKDFDSVFNRIGRLPMNCTGVMSMIQLFQNSIKECKTTTEPKIGNTLQEEVKELIELTIYFTKNETKALLFTDASLVKKLEETMARSWHLMSDAAKIDKSLVKDYFMYHRALSEIHKVSFDSPVRGVTFRKEPILMRLVGEPGVGKTTLSWFLAISALRNVEGDYPNWSDHIYFRQIGRKYWQNYNSVNHKIVVVDEANQINPNFAESIPWAMEAIHLGNNSVCPLDVAECDLKKFANFSSEAIIYTDNLTTPLLSDQINCVEAYLRRIDIDIRPIVLPVAGYLHTEGSKSYYRVDRTKITETMTPNDIWKFEIRKAHSRKVEKVVSFVELEELIKDKMTNKELSHIETRDQLDRFAALKRQNLILDVILTPWCFSLGVLFNIVGCITWIFNPYYASHVFAYNIRHALTLSVINALPRDTWYSYFRSFVLLWLYAFCGTGVLYLVGYTPGQMIRCYFTRFANKMASFFKQDVKYQFLYVLPLILYVIYSLVKNRLNFSSTPGSNDDDDDEDDNDLLRVGKLVESCVSEKYNHEDQKKPKTKPAKVKSVVKKENEFLTKLIPFVKPQSLTWKESLDNKNTREVVDQRVFKNTYMATLLFEDGTHSLFNILFLKGRVALAPMHGFSCVGDRKFNLVISSVNFEKRVFRSDELKFKYIYDYFEGYADPIKRDVILVIFPVTCMEHRDLTKFFMCEEDLVNYKSHQCMMISYTPDLVAKTNDGVYRFIKYAVGTSVKYSPFIHKDSSDHSLIAHTISSVMFTQAGDSGSPVVVFSPHEKYKILGLHTAASANNAFCTAVTQETITLFLEDVAFESKVYCDFENMQNLNGITLDENDFEYGDIFDKGFYPLGKLSFTPYAPTKTKISPSPIHGLVSAVTTKPTKLRDFGDVRVNENALKKWFTPNAYIDPVYINKFRRSLDRRMCEWKFEKRSLEACIMGDETIIPVDRRTSPGLPYIKDNPRRGKQYWLGKGDEWIIDNKRIIENIEFFESRIQTEAVYPPIIMVDQLKDERRDHARVDAGKTRVFAFANIDMILLVRKYLGNFISMFRNTREVSGSLVGIDPYGTEWTDVYMKCECMSNGRKTGFAGDFTNFDGTLNISFLMEIYYSILRKANIDVNSPEARVIFCLFMLIVNAVHVYQGLVFRLCKSQPSGNPITTEINTYYVLGISDCCVETVAERTMKLMQDMLDEIVAILMELHRHYVVFGYGDDVIVILSEKLAKFFDLRLVTTVMSEMGHVFTTDDKTVNDFVFVRPESLTILKRGFLKCDKTGKVFAPLKLDTILEIINWDKEKTDENKILQLRTNLDLVQYELFHHPEEVYNTWWPRILKVLKDNDISYVPRYSFDYTTTRSIMAMNRTDIKLSLEHTYLGMAAPLNIDLNNAYDFSSNHLLN